MQEFIHWIGILKLWKESHIIRVQTFMEVVLKAE